MNLSRSIHRSIIFRLIHIIELVIFLVLIMLRFYPARAMTSFVRSVSTSRHLFKTSITSINFSVIGTLADQTYATCKCAAAVINHHLLDLWLFVALQVLEKGQLYPI